MKHILMIALALMVSVGCKKEKNERKVTIGKSQSVHFSKDSVGLVQSSEVLIMEEGSTLTRNIKGQTWPAAWSGPSNVDVYVFVEDEGFEKIIYQESKLDHDINLVIP